MALFITFEGGEGCGKTYQARALYRRLWHLAIPVVLTREPGGTPLGDRVRRWLKRSTGGNISPHTELMLFCAARAQLVAEVVRPGLESGKVVVCDRYADSTMAYQGYGRGLDLSMIEEANHIATQGTLPDITILLDVPAEVGLSRKRTRHTDRFEREALGFHEKIRKGYLELAAADPERWMVIDAVQPRNVVQNLVWHRLVELFREQEHI